MTHGPAISDEERDFWQRVSEYDSTYSREDFHGNAVATALQLRRDAQDMLTDLSDWAAYCGDTDDEQDYVRWLQRVGDVVTSRIDLALGSVRTTEEAEQQLSFAYAILREVARDAQSRKEPHPL